LWGSPDEYAPWCATVTELIAEHARRDTQSLLNLGCGGGKNAYNLKGRFRVTGLDLSPQMLELARELNPECTFVEGDMRTCRLDDRFDAVLIDDAVSYMTTRCDLRAAFHTAYEHLHPGGVMVVAPDVTKETFEQNRTDVTPAATEGKPENLDVVFVENYYDPDPADETYEGTMVYLIREDGRLRVETDRHTLGLFSIDVWREVLGEVGFQVHEDTYREDGRDHYSFACVRPM